MSQSICELLTEMNHAAQLGILYFF